MTIAGIVLAAGASRRFGQQDKLLAKLHGRPLVEHAARAMRGAHVDQRIAVTAAPEVSRCFEGFEIVELDAPATQSDSLRAGLKAARGLGVSRIVVTLADMPFVSPALIDAVADRLGMAAVTDGTRRCPPAAFPASVFDRLDLVTGDAGARELLAEINGHDLVHADPAMLFDIDTPAALADAERR